VILIVEGFEQARQLIKSFVGKMVHEVYECGDGWQALEAYEQHRSSCALVNTKVKKLDSFSATMQNVATLAKVE